MFQHLENMAAVAAGSEAMRAAMGCTLQEASTLRCSWLDTTSMSARSMSQCSVLYYQLSRIASKSSACFEYVLLPMVSRHGRFTLYFQEPQNGSIISVCANCMTELAQYLKSQGQRPNFRHLVLDKSGADKDGNQNQAPHVSRNRPGVCHDPAVPKSPSCTRNNQYQCVAQGEQDPLHLEAAWNFTHVRMHVSQLCRAACFPRWLLCRHCICGATCCNVRGFHKNTSAAFRSSSTVDAIAAPCAVRALTAARPRPSLPAAPAHGC